MAPRPHEHRYTEFVRQRIRLGIPMTTARCACGHEFTFPTYAKHRDVKLEKTAEDDAA